MNTDTSMPKSTFKTADKVIRFTETLLVSVCLGGMVLITLVQIFMRNALDSGFMLGDPLIKHLVLWTTMLGAGIAARGSEHIRIDIADKVLPEKVKPAVRALVDFFSAAVCAILSTAAYKFLAMEFENKATFGMTEIPVWILEIILPLGFAIIGARFAFGGVKRIVEMAKGF